MKNMFKFLALFGLLAFVIILIAIYFLIHTENFIAKYDDLEKYRFLKLFAYEIKNFKGHKYNLDSGGYGFSFQTKIKHSKYFSEIKEKAQKNQWIKLHENENCMIFSKDTKLHGKTITDIVKIKYFLKKDTYDLLWTIGKQKNAYCE